jgi:tRNA threonylcarbamoyladenosine biosynthesis protein TsaB
MTIGMPCMRIVAIETSGRDATLAALEGEAGDTARLVAEAAVVGPERTARFLAPRMQELLASAGWQAASIQLVAVVVGPGSFTGLRIGVTAAKTLAYAVGAEVIGVNALAVIAAQAPMVSSPLWAVMDAQRQELFAAKFDADRSMVGDVRVLTQPEWLAELDAGDLVSGPVLQKLRANLPQEVESIEARLWTPQAATAGQLAWQDYQVARRDDLWTLLPQYYRQSAAEEKANQRSHE